MATRTSATHARFVAIACITLAASVASAAQAQSVVDGCKPEQVRTQKAIDFGTAYAAAEMRARAWHPDVVVVRLGNTILGPIDADAQSSSWYMVWFSKSAQKTIAVSIANGMLTCSTDNDTGRAVPAMSGSVYLDVKRMLAVGAEKGGAALMAKGAVPMVQFSVGPNSRGRKGIWFLNYQVKQGPSLQVMFDGVSGKFEQAIPG